MLDDFNKFHGVEIVSNFVSVKILMQSEITVNRTINKKAHQNLYQTLVPIRVCQNFCIELKLSALKIAVRKLDSLQSLASSLNL
jgi:hypothetical protein